MSKQNRNVYNYNKPICDSAQTSKYGIEQNLKILGYYSHIQAFAYSKKKKFSGELWAVQSIEYLYILTINHYKILNILCLTSIPTRLTVCISLNCMPNKP